MATSPALPTPPDHPADPGRPEIVDELKANARAWILIDQEERRARAALKEVVLKRKTLSKSIIKGLEAVDEPHISFQSVGVLRPCERVSYRPVNREEVTSAIRAGVGSDDKAEAIVGGLYNKERRQEKRVVGLRFNRTSP